MFPFAIVEEGEAAVRSDGDASVNERRGVAASVRGRGSDGPTATAKATPQNRCELALAIFAQCDPVALGCAVLENGDDRGASVRLRGLEMFTEWAYGKGDSEATPAPTRVIWDLPRRGERRDGANPASERSEGGER